MTLENQDIIQRSINPNQCIQLIFVGTVIAVGSMSTLISGVLQVLFSVWAHSFTSCQLLVKDEHRLLVKGLG